MEEHRYVIVVRYRDVLRFYRSPMDYWVLDHRQWNDAYKRLGYRSSRGIAADRFGIEVVSETNAEAFLQLMASYEMPMEQLEARLWAAFTPATVWWDVCHLFPSAYIDFDGRALYNGTAEGWSALEDCVPDGWTGEDCDHLVDVIPRKAKYWIRDGLDMFRKIMERGT